MYVAGIHISDDRLAFGAEGIVTSSLFIYTAANIYVQRKAFKAADENGGPVKSMPKSPLGKLLIPLQAAAMILPIATYLVAVPLNRGVQPAFIARWALPDSGLGKDTVSILRVVSCAGLTGIWAISTRCFNLLGQTGTFHAIGVRERPKLASTGPFAVVRHPLYAAVLLQELVLAGMSWNYIPLYTFAVCAFAFAVKIPVEEGLIESDDDIGPKYRAYKNKVPYRLIPGIW